MPCSSPLKALTRFLDTTVRAKPVWLRVWILFQTTLSVIFVSLYIFDTYNSTTPVWLEALEVFITFFFMLDYALSLYLSTYRLKHLLSASALIDMATILPVFVSLMLRSANQEVLAPLRVFRALRVVRIGRVLALFSHGVVRQVLTLVITLFSLLVVVAALVQAMEDLSFHLALYFSIVTFSTVGYGDIVPKTVHGKLVMMGLIILGFFMISFQSARLVSLINRSSRYAGRYRFDSPRHVVVCGPLTLDALRHFFFELFRHDRGTKRYKVIILNRSEPPQGIKELLRNPLYDVLWLVGSELREYDLARASAHTAAAAFVFSDRHSPNTGQDAETVMRCLALKSNAPKLPLFVQCVNPETKEHLRRIGGIVNVVSADEMVSGMLAQSCIAPGFSTLITNLARTYSVDFELAVDWRNEYYIGAANEMFPMSMPPFFFGKTFASVSSWIFCNFGLTLFAVEGIIEDVISVVPNPPTYIIRPGDVGFVIAREHNEIRELAMITDDDRRTSLYEPSKFGAADPDRSIDSSGDDTPFLKPIIKVHPAGVMELSNDDSVIGVSSDTGTGGTGGAAAADLYDFPVDGQVPSVASAPWPEGGIAGEPAPGFADSIGLPWWARARALNELVTGDPVGSPNSQFQQQFEDNGNDLTMKLGGEMHAVNTARMGNVPRTKYDDMILDILDVAAQMADSFHLSKTHFKREWKQLCYIASRPRSVDEVIIPNVPFSGHILVRGPLKWALDFLIPLRSRSLERIARIVLLLRQPPPPEEWAIISLFPELYIVLGRHRDLRHGNAAGASKVVIFSPRCVNRKQDLSTSVSVHAPDPTDYLQDAPTVTALREAEIRFRPSFVVADLINATSTRLINANFGKHALQIIKNSRVIRWRPTSTEIPDYHFNTYFASGRVFTHSLLDSLLAQAFYNAGVFKVLQSLFGHRTLVGSNVFQVWVPPAYHSKTYVELYRWMANDLGIIPLGLYRGRKPFDAPASYVVTNPPRSTRLYDTDRVFVLSLREPDSRSGLQSTWMHSLPKLPKKK